MKDQILQKLLDYLESTHDLVLEQVPEVILQALRYEKVSSYATAGLMLGLLAAAISLGYRFWKHPDLDRHGSRETLSFMVPMVSMIALPLFFVQLCMSVDKLIKIYLAPKYFLIQLLVGVKE